MSEARMRVPRDSTARRVLDVVLASIALLLLAPVLLVAAIGIRLASPGPALYRAPRAGIGGRPFLMYKLRTMHLRSDEPGRRITTSDDPRVFAFGALLRRTKIDELPQLVNVLRGEMAIVGPRPEDPVLVERYYTPWQRETLRVRPGLTSPGSLYYDAGAKRVIDGDDPEARYARDVLPLKLALDLVYLRRASAARDLALIARTIGFLAAQLAGRQAFPDPRELPEAQWILAGVTATPAEPEPSPHTAPQPLARKEGVV